jgi:hypothetical protein
MAMKGETNIVWRGRVLGALVILTALSTGSVWADGISITQSLDRTEMAYDETASFEIVLSWPGPQSAYRFDKPLRPRFDRLKVQRFSSSVSSSGTGPEEITTKKYLYELVPTVSGPGTIDPVAVAYVSWPDSIPGELFTEALTIQIAPPVAAEPEEDGNIWPFIFLGVAIVVVGGGAAVIWMRKRVPAAAVLTPAERVIEQLTGLRAECGHDLKIVSFQSVWVEPYR